MKFYEINLQIFATQTTLLSTPGNDLSPEMKTFYDKDLIRQAEPNLVHGQFGVAKPIPAGNGKKIEFRKSTPLAKVTAPLVEGVTPEGNKLNFTTIDAEVLQYGDYIPLSDVLELTAIDNLIVEQTRLLANQAARTLDSIDRDALHLGTNVYYAPKADGTPVESRSALTKDCVLTPDLIMEIVAQLRSANAPTFDGYYVCILHPYVALDIMLSEGWRKPHEYVNTENIYKGEIGEYGGVRFVQSSEAKIYGEGDGVPAGLAVYGTLFMGADAYGTTEVEGGGLEMIVKQKGAGEDPLNQRSSVGWKAMRVTTILVEDYIVRVESVSSKGSTRSKKN